MNYYFDVLRLVDDRVLLLPMGGNGEGIAVPANRALTDTDGSRLPILNIVLDDVYVGVSICDEG